MFKFLQNLFAPKDNPALREALNAGALLVDVRTSAEFAGGSVPGAVNIPLDQIPSQLNKFKVKKPVVVFCRSGNRSGSAKSILAQKGITGVINGGTWQTVKKALQEQ